MAAAESYAGLTTSDPNPIKRRLQQARLQRAIKLMPFTSPEPKVLDFGAGNGQLGHYLFSWFPHAKLTVYEPATSLMCEARRNLARFGNKVKFTNHIDDAPSFEHIFCLSVFEHLLPAETTEAIGQIGDHLQERGTALIEVPNELYVAAIAKGALRHKRRPREFDGRIGAILQAAIGKPPLDRPATQLEPGLPWYPDHLGFDHRMLAQEIDGSEVVRRTSTQYAPFNRLGAMASLDVYYYLQRHVAA